MKGSLCKLWDRMSLGSYIPHQILGRACQIRACLTIDDRYHVANRSWRNRRPGHE
jgi:hypothetical protein